MVVIACASEPAAGSVRAYAASHSPLANRGRYAARCALGALEQHRQSAQPLYGEDQADGGVRPRQLLDGAQMGERAGAGAAVLLGKCEREHIGLSQQLDRVPRKLRRAVDLGRARRDPFPRQRADGVNQQVMLGGHTSINSSGAVVSVSNPVAVTA